MVVSELATRVVAKLLHEPTVALKRDPEGVNMAVVVERLFALASGGDLSLVPPEHCVRPPEPARDFTHQESIAS